MSTDATDLTAPELDAFIKVLDEDLILEVVRSGPLGISRGNKRLSL